MTGNLELYVQIKKLDNIEARILLKDVMAHRYNMASSSASLRMFLSEVHAEVLSTIPESRRYETSTLPKTLDDMEMETLIDRIGVWSEMSQGGDYWSDLSSVFEEDEGSSEYVSISTWMERHSTESRAKKKSNRETGGDWVTKLVTWSAGTVEKKKGNRKQP